jgi:predicted RNA-binding protein with PUA-like domain
VAPRLWPKDKEGGDRRFYHSARAGDRRHHQAAYPDPTDKGQAVTVDVKASEPVRQPVTLAAIKADAKFKDFKLVRQSRLSVVPVSDEHWKLLLKMSGAK